jgi:hypothetical protein
MNARTYHWLILAVCIFSAAATLLQLYAVFVMSLTELPGGFQSLQQGIRESTDIEALRKIALRMTDRDERAYEATRNWISIRLRLRWRRRLPVRRLPHGRSPPRARKRSVAPVVRAGQHAFDDLRLDAVPRKEAVRVFQSGAALDGKGAVDQQLGEHVAARISFFYLEHDEPPLHEA